MKIFVDKPWGNTRTLNVESNETIFSIKRKLREKEGILSELSLVLIYNERLLEDEDTLAHYDISNESTLLLFLSRYAQWDVFFLDFKREDTIDDVKAKVQEIMGIPIQKQLLFDRGRFLEDGSRTLADYQIPNLSTLELSIQPEQGPQSTQRQNKRARPATPTKATAALVPESPSSVLATTHNKEKELEATIISGLKAENKKNEEIARNKEKELEAPISRLKAENKKACMRYFHHGFDSCQKQAEQQGFRGQLNKDYALKDLKDS